MEEKIVHALITNCEKSGCRIIADYTTEGSSIHRDIILEVIKSTMTTDEERISIQRGNYTVHLLIGELRYAALTSTPDGPIPSSRQALSSQIFLDRLRSVYKELPILADLSHGLNRFRVTDLSAPLEKILGEFNCQDFEVVPKIEDNLTEIRRVLMESVQKLIDRGQKLDDLVRKTQTLEITARSDFRRAHKSSRKKKSIIAVVAIVLIASIAMIISPMAISFFFT